MNAIRFVMMMAAGVFAAAGTAAPRRTAGPHKGRIVEAGAARVEFVLDKERRAHVYRLDGKSAATDLGDLTITLKAKLKGGTKTVNLTRTTTGLDGSAEKVPHAASAAALPSPDGYQLTMSVKAKGRASHARFDLVEHACDECGLAEYACICGH